MSPRDWNAIVRASHYRAIKPWNDGPLNMSIVMRASFKALNKFTKNNQEINNTEFIVRSAIMILTKIHTHAPGIIL